MSDPTSSRRSTPDAALERYLEAALEGDRRGALRAALDALDAGWAPADIYVDVLQAAQAEVGRRWAANEISVAREHTATAVAQYVLARMYEKLPRPERVRGRALVTGVEGERHQLGANMVADLLETDGWDVRFLGSDLPDEEIVAAARRMEPDLVGISVTLTRNVDGVAELIDRIRSAVPGASPRFLVGGAAFAKDPDASGKCGADAVADDLRDAVRVARSLEP